MAPTTPRRRTARAATPHDRDAAAGFAAFMATRPEPLDRVERVLCRLVWLYDRLSPRAARQDPAPIPDVADRQSARDDAGAAQQLQPAHVPSRGDDAAHQVAGPALPAGAGIAAPHEGDRLA
jgi:hypothetical protein